MQWRLLPGDLPPWTAVWKQFCRWRDSGVWRLITGYLLRWCRVQAGRKPEPSAALLDAQAVPSGCLGPREHVGVDGGKRVRGRKRHLLCDLSGLPIAIGVTSAQPHDSRGGQTLLETAKPQLRGLTKVFADAAYQGLVGPCGHRARRPDRHPETSRRDPLVRPAPAALAGRADLRLARPQPPASLRLRSDRDLIRGVRSRGRRRVHAGPAALQPISHFPSSEVCPQALTARSGRFRRSLSGCSSGAGGRVRAHAPGLLRPPRGWWRCGHRFSTGGTDRDAGRHCCVVRGWGRRKRLTRRVDQTASASSVNATATRLRVATSVPSS